MARAVQPALPGLGRPRSRTGPTCRTCGQPIRFVQLETGKTEPLDRRPSQRNGYIRIRKSVGYELNSLDARRQRDAGVPLFTPHFATCPDTPWYRRRL